MKVDRNTVILVAVTMGVEFIFDTAIHSLAASKGGKFKLQLPKGKHLRNLVVVGVVSGLVLDYVLKQVHESQKTTLEKRLDKIVQDEKERIARGEREGMLPKEIRYLETREG